jgi:hypothetical protein
MSMPMDYRTAYNVVFNAPGSWTGQFMVFMEAEHGREHHNVSETEVAMTAQWCREWWGEETEEEVATDLPDTSVAGVELW